MGCFYIGRRRPIAALPYEGEEALFWIFQDWRVIHYRTLQDKKPIDLSDRELADGYSRTRESSYFEELFERYRNVIHASCLRFFHGNRARAEDATQETFTRALAAIGRAGIENVSAWLFTIARNCCIDTQRREHKLLFESEHSQSTQQQSTDDPEQKAWVEQIMERINELGDKQRIVVKLYLQGFSYEEICRMTHYNQRETKSALQTAKDNIRKSLAKSSKERENRYA